MRRRSGCSQYLLHVVVVVLAFIDVSADDAKPRALQDLNVLGSTQRATFVAGGGVPPGPCLDRRCEKKATLGQQDFRHSM